MKRIKPPKAEPPRIGEHEDSCGIVLFMFLGAVVLTMLISLI